MPHFTPLITMIVASVGLASA